jgi:hypothetical protein
MTDDEPGEAADVILSLAERTSMPRDHHRDHDLS